MKKIHIYIVSAVLVATTTFLACSKPDNVIVDPGPPFDKTMMLTSYADNVILPEYKEFDQRLYTLQVSAETFIADPSAATQATAKAAYTAAHLQYQHICAFQFGPAETHLFDLFVNFSGGLDYNFTTSGDLTGFSTDSATIENNIANGGYDLTIFTRNSLYSQGFPALNYLLFAPDAIAKFGANKNARRNYTIGLVARIKNLTDKVRADWDTYRTEFIGNTQTNSGSPISYLVNQMAYQLDIMKGPRLGWPLGKQSNGIAFPTKCEAYYAGISVALAKENIKSLKNMYTGGQGGIGISSYLVSLGHSTLNTDVLAQFDAVYEKLNLIPDPLSASITSQAGLVDAAYKEVQKLLTLIKTDVASATSVQITFVDNDGD